MRDAAAEPSDIFVGEAACPSAAERSGGAHFSVWAELRDQLRLDRHVRCELRSPAVLAISERARALFS